MAAGRRSDILLSALALVAIANGVLLGLSFFGLLATGLKILGKEVPPVNLAVAFGALAGLGVLGLSLNRQRALREGRYRSWGFHQAASPSLRRRFEDLVASSSLQQAPALCVLDDADPNAFAVGRSREDASVVVTTGLLGLLEVREQDAVLAHQLSHVESGAIKEVGFADAVADSVGEIARLRGRFLWGPKQIVIDTLPVWAVMLGGMVLIELIPEGGGVGVALLGAVVALAVLWAFVAAAFHSLWGLVQLFLFVTFFGPLTAIETALALPSVLALSRLTSRTRVYEADARSIELTGGGAALVSALGKMEGVERSPVGSDLGSALRFALFVAPRAQNGLQALTDRIYSTHPSIADRIEAIRSKGQRPARAAAVPA